MNNAVTRLLRARDLIESEYRQAVTVDRAAREACLSPYHFQRLYRSHFGETPGRHVIRKRLELARKLLLYSDLPVTGIMLETGYSSLGNFSDYFLRQTGYSPSEYRKTFAGKIFPVDLGYLSVPGCFIAAYRYKIAGYRKPDRSGSVTIAGKEDQNDR
jgi:transcriptional regulator GlxA family with amidase domain